ncbi:MAG: hypothetical protein J6K96_00560 [Treponema sp.]|nr:hypothetical protein [Treponema sp.]
MKFENDSDFADYSLEEIKIDYDKIAIEIRREKKYRIDCLHFLAISYIGQWDENIIENVFITENDDFIAEVKSKIKKNNNINFKGGGTRDFNADWICLTIRLIDALEIKIVCSDVEINGC